jgi:hypothetical protein
MELLQIRLDDFGRSLVRTFGILAELLARAPLPQKIPQPVELNIDVIEPAAIVDRQRAAFVEERVLLGHERLDMLMKLLVVHPLSIPVPRGLRAVCG